MTTVEQPPATPAVTQTGAACPSCGASLAPDQQFCVECGARVGTSLRRHPSWRLPAAIVAVVVLLAGAAVAYTVGEVASDSQADSAAPAPTQTAAQQAAPVQPAQPPTTADPAAPAEAGTPTVPGTTDTGAQAEGQGTQTPDSAGDDSSGEIEEWPTGESAYTVILFSTDTRGDAERKARQAIEQGVPAGVLHSDDYSSLRAGYWVVFAGRFDTRDEAEEEAESYASLGFADGYPRFVEE